VVVLGGRLVDVENLLAQRTLLAAGAAGALLVFDGDAEALAQRLDGLGEIELFGFADERDDVAGLAAAEALVETLVGIDVEGRRFFVVEGAEALEAGAGLAEGRDPAHHIDDVHAKLQIAETGGFDDGHGAAGGAKMGATKFALLPSCGVCQELRAGQLAMV